jgi:hypothetical protein
MENSVNLLATWFFEYNERGPGVRFYFVACLQLLVLTPQWCWLSFASSCQWPSVRERFQIGLWGVKWRFLATFGYFEVLPNWCMLPARLSVVPLRCSFRLASLVCKSKPSCLKLAGEREAAVVVVAAVCDPAWPFDSKRSSPSYRSTTATARTPTSFTTTTT